MTKKKKRRSRTQSIWHRALGRFRRIHEASFGDTKRPLQLLSLALGALLIAAPILNGGVHLEFGLALSVLASFLAIAALLFHWQAFGRLGPIGWSLLLIILMTALQLLPLPASLVAFLSPEAFYEQQQTQQLLGQSSHFQLSLSPPRTAMALWLALASFGVFLTAQLHLRDRNRFGTLIPKFLLLGIIYLFFSILQSLYKIAPFVSFNEASLFHTPLLNPNHTAAFFGAISLISLGGIFLSRDRSKNALFFLAYFIFAFAMLITQSRGAFAAWVLAHLAFAFIMVSRKLSRGVHISALVGLLLVSSLATLSIAEEEISTLVNETRAPVHALLYQELDSEDGEQSLGKLITYRDTLPIIKDYPTTGMGRGAFRDTYSRYASHGWKRQLSFLENEHIELILELGFPIGGLCLVLLFFGLIQVTAKQHWRKEERPVVAALLAAAVFLLLQNLFDFNIRFPGTGFLLFVILGALQGRLGKYRGGRFQKKTGTPQAAPQLRRLAILALLLFSTFTALATLNLAKQGWDDRDIEALQTAINDESSDWHRALETAALLRPTNSHIAMLAGVGMLRIDHDSELAQHWLERAILLAPQEPRAHLLLGRLRIAQGHESDGHMHLVKACNLDSGRTSPALLTLATLSDELILSPPFPQEDADLLGLSDNLLARLRYDTTLELAKLLNEAHPHRSTGLIMQLRVMLALGFPEAAHSTGERLVRQFPKEWSSYHDFARVLNLEANYTKSHEILNQGLQIHDDSIPLHFARVELLVGHGREFLQEDEWQQELNLAFEALRPYAISKPSNRYRFYILQGRFFLDTNNLVAAETAFTRAKGVRPDNKYARTKLLEIALEKDTYPQAKTRLEELKPYLNEAELLNWTNKVDSKRKWLNQSN